MSHFAAEGGAAEGGLEGGREARGLLQSVQGCGADAGVLPDCYTRYGLHLISTV